MPIQNTKNSKQQKQSRHFRVSAGATPFLLVSAYVSPATWADCFEQHPILSPRVAQSPMLRSMRRNTRDCCAHLSPQQTGEKPKRFRSGAVSYEKGLFPYPLCTTFASSQTKHDQLEAFHQQTKTNIHRELVRIYTEFAPERIPKIAKQLEDLEFQEQVLLDSVRRKYLSSQ